MRFFSGLLLLSVFALSACVVPISRKNFELNNELDGQIEAFVDPQDGVFYRLPNETYPIHYDITLKTDIHMGIFLFFGTVDIHLKVKSFTNKITVHQRQLSIISVALFTKDGIPVPDITYNYIENVEFLEITSPWVLQADEEFLLKIVYQGTLRTDNAGFYRSSYQNPQGATVWLATTQFESTDARHGFPCYDEPGIRAQYTIAIEHHSSYTALSNMPVESITLSAVTTDYVITKFKRSPTYQTYVIAYVVSDFSNISNRTATKYPQRVFTSPAKIGDAEFALDHGIKVINAFENYLKVDYLLPKIDQIAIADFAAGFYF